MMWLLVALAAWLTPALLLSAGMFVIVKTTERLDPKDWRRCAADDPANPAAKTCWVRVDAGTPFCTNHDGSGRGAVYT
jgi:hypothetical protein